VINLPMTDNNLPRSVNHHLLIRYSEQRVPSTMLSPAQHSLCLHHDHRSVTLSYMKASTMTIRLDAKIQRELDRLSRQLGRSRSDIVRDALRRQVALLRFERSRRALLPLAEAQGILTDEDVFRIVS